MSEITTESIQQKVAKLAVGLETKQYKELSLVEWRPILARECLVYVYNDIYLARRFDQINFNFCTKDTAKEILVDNLYALLRYKYFPKSTDEIEERISEIIKSFTTNLKSVLIKVSFDTDTECERVQWLPDGCVAFRNGVFNFRTNKWLFEYDKVELKVQKNYIYLYNPKYIITWYINIEFSSLDIDLMNTTLEDFIETCKLLNQQSKNYCFELMYNMSHDMNHKFSMGKFEHLCEILGFICLQSFCQKFEIFVGSGQNGKNSLLDGCFSSRVIPSPANISMTDIEEDKFVTGALENKAHNFYLETEAETIIKSANLKQITGSMMQTVEHKGVDRYSSIINCKPVWSANDQDKLKFKDTTTGFRRRINLFEVYYRWDPDKKFLKLGDYFDTSFSEDLSELKGDISNTIIFIYFAMFGIKNATDNFTRPFKFSRNDWRLQYTDMDFDLKEKIESIDKDLIAKWFSNPIHREEGKVMFYDLNRTALYMSSSIKQYGIFNYTDYVDKFIKDDTEDLFMNYFVEYDVYMSLKFIQTLLNDLTPTRQFSSEVKKLYGISNFINLTGNKSYVKVTFRNNKLKIIS